VEELACFHVHVMDTALIEVSQIDTAEIAVEGDAVDAAEVGFLGGPFSGPFLKWGYAAAP
jgi:hypothetical protein